MKVGTLMNVWVFNGVNSRFPSGIFGSKRSAEIWIEKHRLTGILTLYPMDEGVYDWAIKNDFFNAKKDSETSPEFIQRFTSASQEHYHYENGQLD